MHNVNVDEVIWRRPSMEKERKEGFIAEKELANGMTVAFYDLSRKIAKGCWLVEIICEGVCPILDEWWSRCAGENVQFLFKVQEIMGKTLTFSVKKVRHFVTVADKDAVAKGFLDQTEKNIMPYLGNEKFPEKLFVRRYNEIKEKLLLEDMLQPRDEPLFEEDDGSADFPLI